MGDDPAPHRWDRLALALLTGAAVAIAVAPLAVADDYSLLTDTTSESGAQGVSGGWVVRFGFLAFAAAVARVAWISRHRVGPWVLRGHGAVVGSVIAAAAFATRPWRLDAPYDPVEHTLHLIASIGVGAGAAIVAGALATTGWRVDRRIPRDLIVVVAIGLVAWPMMAVAPEFRGLFQRIMWAVAIIWYASAAQSSRMAVRS
ncbi:MAG: DUF998 domain-containing protein [Actinomycetota bacterium]